MNMTKNCIPQNTAHLLCYDREYFEEYQLLTIKNGAKNEHESFFLYLLSLFLSFETQQTN